VQHPPRTGDRPLACVLGEVDLVRALQLGGIPSVVVAPPGDPARYSRSAAAGLNWVDPWRRPDEAVDRLLMFARRQVERPVLYFDGDWDLLLVSRSRSRLQEGFRFVVADPVLVEDLVDKARFQVLADRLHLPVPRGQRVSVHNTPQDLGLRFPLVAKPLTRQEETWRQLSRGKAIVVEDERALGALCRRFVGVSDEMLVQEAIPGPESAIESYHVYVDENGDIAGHFAGRKLRTYPSSYCYSTALTTTDSRDVMALGADIVERLGLRGVAKLDFKRAQNGSLVLLEVNPRFNLWHHPGAIAGVNLPALVYCDLVGIPRPRPAAARPGVRWCSLAHDLQAARNDKIGIAAWLKWALACEAKSGFAWDDPLPLVRAAARRLESRVAAGVMRITRAAKPAAPGGVT
jgi:D-aspartate ligase